MVQEALDEICRELEKRIVGCKAKHATFDFGNMTGFSIEIEHNGRKLSQAFKYHGIETIEEPVYSESKMHYLSDEEIKKYALDAIKTGEGFYPCDYGIELDENDRPYIEKRTLISAGKYKPFVMDKKEVVEVFIDWLKDLAKKGEVAKYALGEG